MISQGLSAQLAKKVERSLIKDRGQEQAIFQVLFVDMPAVLTELFFISNSEDEKLMSEIGPKMCARGLVVGIKAFLENRNLRANMQKNLNKNLGELLELFLAYIQVELGSSANTIAAYSSDLRIFFAHLEKNGVLYAEELKREHLLDFLEKRASAGISAKSMHRVMCSIRRYFRFLRKEQIIPNNPIADIELPRVEMRLPKTVAIKEIDSLLSKPNIERERGLRDAAIIARLYGAGLRVSELSGLKLADLDLARGYLKILGKGQKERVVPLNEKALTIVEAYLLYGRPLLLNDQASMLVFIRKGASI